MFDYQNILLCIDCEEDPSHDAFEHAFRFARQRGAKLYVCTIIDTKPYTTMARFDRHLIEEVKNAANDKLKEFLATAKAEGIEAEVILETGAPSAKIARSIVPSYKIDLIIAGATGGNRLDRALNGSVSHSILNKANCDVFIVKKPTEKKVYV